jgi:hypothetical protein
MREPKTREKVPHGQTSRAKLEATFGAAVLLFQTGDENGGPNLVNHSFLPSVECSACRPSRHLYIEPLLCGLLKRLAVRIGRAISSASSGLRYTVKAAYARCPLGERLGGWLHAMAMSGASPASRSD